MKVLPEIKWLLVALGICLVAVFVSVHLPRIKDASVDIGNAAVGLGTAALAIVSYISMQQSFIANRARDHSIQIEKMVDRLAKLNADYLRLSAISRYIIDCGVKKEIFENRILENNGALSVYDEKIYLNNESLLTKWTDAYQEIQREWLRDYAVVKMILDCDSKHARELLTELDRQNNCVLLFRDNDFFGGNYSNYFKYVRLILNPNGNLLASNVLQG